MLTVKTDNGEFILDNQNDEILLWSETGYRFVKRQSQTDPNIWVALGDPRAGRVHRDCSALTQHRGDYAAPVTSPPLPVPRPGPRAAGSPPARPHYFCTMPGSWMRGSSPRMTAEGFAHSCTENRRELTRSSSNLFAYSCERRT